MKQNKELPMETRIAKFLGYPNEDYLAVAYCAKHDLSTLKEFLKKAEKTMLNYNELKIKLL